MALRYAEEPERRLTPEEARAFLQVHSEREAAGTGPSLDDLAETLGLTPEEARSILAETRLRAGAPRSETRTQRPPRLLFWIGSGLALILAAQIAAANLTTLPDNRPVSEVGVPPRPARAAVPPRTAERAAEVPLDRFYARIDPSLGPSLLPDVASFPAKAASSPLPALTPEARDALLSDLARKIGEAVEDRAAANPAWGRADRLTMLVGVSGRRATHLEIPLDEGQLSVPEGRERLLQTVERMLDVAWPQISSAAVE